MILRQLFLGLLNVIKILLVHYTAFLSCFINFNSCLNFLKTFFFFIFCFWLFKVTRLLYLKITCTMLNICFPTPKSAFIFPCQTNVHILIHLKLCVYKYKAHFHHYGIKDDIQICCYVESFIFWRKMKKILNWTIVVYREKLTIKWNLAQNYVSTGAGGNEIFFPSGSIDKVCVPQSIFSYDLYFIFK